MLASSSVKKEKRKKEMRGERDFGTNDRMNGVCRFWGVLSSVQVFKRTFLRRPNDTGRILIIKIDIKLASSIHVDTNAPLLRLGLQRANFPLFAHCNHRVLEIY